VSDSTAFQRALASLQAGKLIDAERLFKEFLATQAGHVAALNLLSVVLIQLGRFDEAERYIKQVIGQSATSDVTLYNYGIVLKALKRPAEALERFDQALAINAAVAETWNNRGTVFNDLGRYSEAIADFDKALSINPTYAEVFCNKAKSLAELKKYDLALGSFDAALALKADFAAAWVGRGNVLAEMKRYDDALAAYERVAELRPELAEGWVGRGNVLVARRQYDQAAAAYQRAVNLQPGLAIAWLGLGNILFRSGRHSDAIAAYDQAVRLDATLAEAWFGRGNVFVVLNRHDDAFAAYDAAFRLQPKLKYAEGNRLHAKLQLCDWSDLDAEVVHLLMNIRNDELASQPFGLLSFATSAADQLQCAKRYVAEEIAGAAADAMAWRAERYSHQRIRVAYVSSGLKEHPISLLTVGLFEQHDRKRFETYGIALSRAIESEFQTRLRASFDHYVEACDQSDADVAQMLRRLEIDIAVDLDGHTAGARPAILAARPCPLQINYLGYPATMGAPFIDYVVADRHIIPPAQRSSYSERVVYLPGSFQANDAKRPVPANMPSRSAAGLPEDAFIFCSFNQSFKLLPGVFEIWLRLLKQIENSVLWMLATNTTAAHNLRSEAQRRGVAPERILLAPRAAYRDYLAQYRLADLFLDTFPFNAGTTASDALWCGLPVLTCSGEPMAARMAGSLLHAVGLPELVTRSPADYEALALRIASDRTALSDFKARLARNRERCPLFDTEQFTRHVEAAYMEMWQRQERNEPPASFAVAEPTRPASW
jgi:protein O-GlcNAc transferase